MPCSKHKDFFWFYTFEYTIKSVKGATSLIGGAVPEAFVVFSY